MIILEVESYGGEKRRIRIADGDYLRFIVDANTNRQAVCLAAKALTLAIGGSHAVLEPHRDIRSD